MQYHLLFKVVCISYFFKLKNLKIYHKQIRFMYVNMYLLGCSSKHEFNSEKDNLNAQQNRMVKIFLYIMEYAEAIKITLQNNI